VQKECSNKGDRFYFDDEEEDKIEVIVRGRKVVFESEKFIKIKKKKRNENDE